MDCIVPCRSSISERFPIASFVVRAPRERFYEVACSTDPRLFHTDYAAHRTERNFYSSRADGLLPGDPAGGTFFIPPEQLRRFAGARRIYYALGTYGGRQGEDARFSISPEDLSQVPSIGLSDDFTGRTLDRGRAGQAASVSAVYGAVAAGDLRWGGDSLLESQRRVVAEMTTRVAEYDDGYGPALWGGGEVRGEAAPFDDGYGSSPHAASTGERCAACEARAQGPFFGEASEALAEEPLDPVDDDGPERARAQAAEEPLDPVDDDGPERARAQAAEEPLDPVDDDGPERARAQGDAEDATLLEYAPEDDGDPTAEPSGFGTDEGLDAGDGRDDAPWSDAHGQDFPEEAEDVGGAYGRYGRGDSSPRAAKADDYQDEPAEETSLPVGPASAPLGVVPLDVAEKVRILRVVGRAEGGTEAYAAVQADGDARDRARPGLGLCFGFLLFPQRSGALGRVLRRAKARDDASGTTSAVPPEHRFAALFGSDAKALLDTTDPDVTTDPDARLAPVGGKRLWEEPWLARFRAAGQVGYVQAAQNETGVVDYFDRVLPIARALGLRSPRGLAVLVDRAVHMGVGAASSWIMTAAGTIRSEAERERALRALGYDPGDLAAFQRRAGETETEGRWGPLTHAALMVALRSLGNASPLPPPSSADVLSSLSQASAGSPFAARVRALVENRADFDDTVAYEGI